MLTYSIITGVSDPIQMALVHAVHVRFLEMALEGGSLRSNTKSEKLREDEIVEGKEDVLPPKGRRNL